MALKPTIYKALVDVSDLDNDKYHTLNLTLAQHPSETIERMMVRLLVYCLNATESLAFAKGLSSIEEPDIWEKTLDNQIALWIEVGEPDPERLRKATHLADRVMVYCFNTKSDVWWQQSAKKIVALDAEVIQFAWPDIVSLSALVERTMNFSVTVTGNSAFIATAKGECEVSWCALNG